MTKAATNGLNRLMRATRAFAARFAASTRGNVAMMFGLALPGLLMISLGAVDIHQASKVKANLQDALDAAALAAARSKFTDDVNINRVGLAALKANMPTYFGASSTDTASFVLQGNNIVADARVNVKVLVANIVLPPYGQLLDDYLPVGSHSEVLRASRDVEVAMALDITGSMKGQPLIDLKAAASELIDIVVQTQQTPFYSRVALVPYSMGVNVGGYANAVRGTPIEATNISAAAWSNDTAKSISTVTKATPAVVTANSHGLTTGDTVWVAGVNNGADVNDRIHTVRVLDGNRFELTGRASSKAGTGGTVRKCILSDCTIVVTSAGHGLSDSERIEITGVQGMTELNNKTYQVHSVTADTFSTGVFNMGYGTYNRGGKVQCGRDGCRKRIYLNPSSQVKKIDDISTCVSERPGVAAFTDEAPSSVSRRVGRNYVDTGNPCLAAQITPLSSSIADLKSKIAGYQVSGSTAGQIGIAWAWYMVSPHFGGLWSGESVPAPYAPLTTLKVVILMTDGEFNTPYCQGVISRDAPDDGSAGAANMQIDCSSNGTPFAQSVSLCQAMRANDVIVYTVGFNLSSKRGGAGVDTAIEVMETCATTKDKHFFAANSGTDLKEAFKAIGRDITRLRIAR